MKIIHNFFINNELCEDAQSINLRFAFCEAHQNKDELIYQDLHCLVKCRDFLNDFHYCMNTDKSFYIYGFDILKGHQKTQDLLMHLHFPDINCLEIFKSNFNHYMEIYDKLSDNDTTKIIYEKDYEIILLVDNNWFLTSQSISAFTFLLRLFCNPVEQNKCIITDFLDYIEGDEDHTDAYIIFDYPYNFKNNFRTFIKTYKKLYKIIPSKNYLNDHALETKSFIHSYSGIITFLNYLYNGNANSFYDTVFITNTRNTYFDTIKND